MVVLKMLRGDTNGVGENEETVQYCNVRATRTSRKNKATENRRESYIWWRLRQRPKTGEGQTVFSFALDI